MPLTVANIESEIVGRIKGKLVTLGLSTLTTGANPDLRGPIRKSLGYVGLMPVNPTAAVNSDFAPVVGWDCEKVFDAATVEALYVCLGQCTDVDEKVGLNEQYWSQLGDQVRAQIKMLEDRLMKPYGPNVPRGAVGTMAGGVPMPNDTLNVVRSRVNPTMWPYPR